MILEYKGMKISCASPEEIVDIMKKIIQIEDEKAFCCNENIDVRSTGAYQDKGKYTIIG